jgi:glycosyltransferase involved in cell wall biosynthesis
LSIIFVSREDLPTYRPDVCVLIERELRESCDLHIIAAKSDSTKEEPFKDKQYYHIVKPHNVFKRFLGAKLAKVIYKLFKTITVANSYKSEALIIRDNAFLVMLLNLYYKFSSKKVVFWVSILMGDLLVADSKKQKRVFYYLYSVVYQRVEIWAMKSADMIISQSDAMSAYFTNVIGVQCDVFAVPMGIDEQLINEFKQHNNSMVVKGRIGYLGAIDSTRNIPFLLDAIESLKVEKKFSYVTLVIVGGSENLNTIKLLENEISQRGLSEVVRFTGHLERSAAWREILNCEVCISYIPRNVSFDLSSPTKLVEYLALGKKVVANDIPDQVKLVGQVGSGYLCESNLSSLMAGIKNQLQQEFGENEEVELKNKTLMARGYSVLGRQLGQKITESFSNHSK